MNMCPSLNGYRDTVLSGREQSSRPDSTQAGTLDTNTNRGHTTAYQYRHMTKRAAEAWQALRAKDDP
jgi:hypothetical protein